MSSSSISTISNSLTADPDTPIERAKKAAAFACGDAYIKSGQRIGIGSSSTVRYFVEFLQERVQAGVLQDLVCIPTSFMTRKWLCEANLPVSTVDQHWELDICIDGADEVDSRLNLIKGGGGCLTQEKIVQTCSKEFVVIADINKKSTHLGDRYKVIPIEVVQSAAVPVQKWVSKMFGGTVELRIASTKFFPLITDNNNYILEWNFPKAVLEQDWMAVHRAITCLPGVVETGLFLGVADCVYFATPEGAIEVHKK